MRFILLSEGLAEKEVIRAPNLLLPALPPSFILNLPFLQRKRRNSGDNKRLFPPQFLPSSTTGGNRSSCGDLVDTRLPGRMWFLIIILQIYMRHLKLICGNYEIYSLALKIVTPCRRASRPIESSECGRGRDSRLLAQVGYSLDTGLNFPTQM